MEKGKALAFGSVISCIVTCLLTLLLAFVFYQFRMTTKHAAVAVLVVYTLSSFAGGFIGGKLAKSKQFLIGLLIGFIYALILLLVSFVVLHKLDGSVSGAALSVILCMASGMFGGMIS